jgi:hypothetical protein
MKGRLGGVLGFLICFNLAVMLLAIGLAPPSGLIVPKDYDPINVMLISRQWNQFFWIMAASLIFSGGVYFLAVRWLSEE